MVTRKSRAVAKINAVRFMVAKPRRPPYVFFRQWSLPTRKRVNRLTISGLMTPADVPQNIRTLAGVFL
jgi:hypothetical protein